MRTDQNIDSVLATVKLYAVENGLSPDELMRIFEAGRWAFKMAGTIPMEDKVPVAFHDRGGHAVG